MKRIRKNTLAEDEMLPEYDFRGMKGVRGKYAQAMRQGYTITIYKEDGSTLVKEVKPKGMVLLESDVLEYFPNSESVNTALRSLITLLNLPRRTKPAKSSSR